jgi:Flp pilus assembly protein TadG
MKRKLRSHFHDESGQAVAELALVIPLLLVMVLAIVDFGRAVNYWNSENHVANLGARYAAVGNWPTCGGGTQTTLAAYVKCQAGDVTNNNLSAGSTTNNGNGIPTGGATVCISAVGATAGSATSIGMPVTVKVSSGYNWIPFLGTFLGASSSSSWTSSVTTSITGSATMRLEQPLAQNVITQTTQC